MVGVILEQAPEVEYLIRMRDIEECAVRLRYGQSFREVLTRADKNIDPPFQNTLLSGPKGTGKTTRAQVLAFKYRDIGITPKDARIGFIEVSKTIGNFVGNSETALKDFMKEVGKGIIILDEIDSLLDVHSYGKNVLNFLNGHMGNSPNNPIFIATCYDTRENELLDSVKGLRRRFRHVFTPPMFDIDELTQIFSKKAEALGLNCGPGVLDIVSELLNDSQRIQKKDFGNAGEVKNLFDTTLDIHGANLARDGVRFEHLQREDFRKPENKIAMTLTSADLPKFDPDSRSYVPMYGYVALAVKPPRDVKDTRLWKPGDPQ